MMGVMTIEELYEQHIRMLPAAGGDDCKGLGGCASLRKVMSAQFTGN